MPDTLLEVRNLQTRFHGDEGEVRAVDGVSFDIRRGETLALVGESGCGKSATALSIMRLIPNPPGEIAAGKITLHENDSPRSVLQLDENAMRQIRGNRIAMVFQEPMTSLNPVLRIGDQVAEALEAHRAVTHREALDRAADMLRRVGISAPRERLRAYPHELSGGMRQRVMIAMALMCDPVLVLADEPTTALDVTVQAQILGLLREIQSASNMSVLIITHDLGVVAQVADRVCVMYAGKIVERANTEELFANPLHPYTQGLLRSLPRLGPRQNRLDTIPGSVPDPRAFPSGCRFHPRCDLTRARSGDNTVLEHCAGSEAPELRQVKHDHWVSCLEVEGYARAMEKVTEP